MQSLFTGEDYKKKLEEELKAYFGVKEVLLTQGGRVGLYYLLRALPHKKVYLPAYTCWAVPEAITHAKKELEYVDIKLDDYNMDVEKLRKAITPQSIILATHQFGIPCDIDEIAALARENDCLVLEDNAAGFGSTYKGKRTGSFAAAGIISFEFSKTLTCGKGGAILFNDRDLYLKVKNLYAAEIRTSRYLEALKHILYLSGYSVATNKLMFNATHFLFRMTKGLTTGYPDYDTSEMSDLYLSDFDDVRAKLTLSGMKEIDQVTGKKREIAEFYLRELADCDKIELPVYPDYKSPVFMRFPFRVTSGKKEDFYAGCTRKGLDLAFTFSYSCDADRERSPYSWKAADKVLNLPVYSKLSQGDLQAIKKVMLTV
jgi:dTDP-4-amino-4,6-dideoxygalactose transaminase